MRKVGIIAGMMLGLTLATLWHDTGRGEDGRVIWICSVHGDGWCGPGADPVIIRPDRLLEW